VARPESATDKPDEQAPADTSSSNTLSAPGHEEIAKLAHSYWLNRRPEEGTAEDDWFRAEKDLSRRSILDVHPAEG